MLARPRKYKTDAARQKAYRQARDNGTDELVAKRLKLVEGGDPALATCPLDVMLAKKQLMAEEHQAAWIYLLLHRKVFGASHARAADHEWVGRGSLASSYVDDIDGDRRRREVYDRADRTLKKYDRWARKLLRDVGLSWSPLESPHSVKILRNGLGILRREFGI